MSDELNFNELSLSDVSIGGKPLVESAPEQATEDNTPSGTEATEQVESTPEQVQDTTPESEEEGVSMSRQAAPTYDFKDDFIKGAVEYYEKTGDLTPYLQAKTVDFAKMDDAEIMRRSLREQYPDVSDKAFDRLYQQQVVDKFKLDAEQWGEDDAELGKELLRTEADKLRAKYIEWQKGFAAPEPQADPNAEEQERATMEAIAQFERAIKENPITKSILETKRVSVKAGDDEFNYELPEANSLVDMTLDNNKFFQQFAAGEGQLDYNKWYKTVAYSQNPEQFERALINFGKTLGRSEVTKEIKNPSTAPVGDVPTEGSGDFTTGLLQAFANRGISK
jgi:hypothetical protein